MHLRCLSATLALVCSATASAAVSVPGFFSDHMVLQREIPVAVWGRAAAGEAVKVQLGQQAAVSTTAGADGTWQVKLPPTPAGGPFALVVSGTNTIRIEDVLVGEVWVCSGQSNMEWVVANSLNPDQEKAEATDGQIRQLLVPKRPASQPEAAMDAKWTVSSPGTVGGFTACGYFMAKSLRKELGVPIGLINTSWGGTRIEPWIAPAGFESVPTLTDILAGVREVDPATPAYQKRVGDHLAKIEEWTKKARDNAAAGKAFEPPPEPPATITPIAKRKDPQQQPTALYNGMVHALVGYGIRGAIWYQGESNHVEGSIYADKMKALIGGWRKIWGVGDFPFYFVQIAPYRYGGEDPNIVPKFWTTQASALAIPNTGMVITSDIGNVEDIHPRNKQEVGRRLALQALAKTYGKQGVVADGPAYASMAVEGGKVRVKFANAAGLKSRDGKALSWFEVIGEDGDWTKAEAVVDGETVVASSAAVPKPIGVRFAWHREAEPNLANGAGLPASAFTAGGGAYADQLSKVADARGYKLVYDLDLTRLGADIQYTVNASDKAGIFDRVGYLLEVQREGSPIRYAWASMDAFTADPVMLGIPTVASGASFQMAVKNLVVETNQPGISAGSFPTGGNIEMWPNNYGPANGGKVAGASDAIYDFGDVIGEPRDGYGCLQVHNAGEKQTILAVNNWKAGNAADVGIGNSTGEQRDWTFSRSASGYKSMRLRVLVHPKP